MVSRIGQQFGRWKACEKLELLGGVESIGLLLLVLFMIPFPNLDLLLATAGYVYLGSVFIAFCVAFIEQAPNKANSD
jgi:hypothetical protein